MTKWISLIIVCVGSLVLCAGASASSTRSMPGVPCSASAALSVDSAKGTMSYKGGVSCAGGVGQKTIDVVPQVRKIGSDGKPLWYSISLASLYQGPTPANPLRLSASREAVKGHVYRLLVYGQVALPDGRLASTTACSGSGCAGSSSISIRPTYTYVSQPPKDVKVADISCWIGHHELIFTLVNRSLVMNYGGHSVCDRHVQQTLSVCTQVVKRINGKNVWFTINGSCLSRSAREDFVELTTARTAYTGHGYRVKVSATFRYGALTRAASIASSLGNP